MTDRELLEMAAKAIGREIHHWSTILPGPMLTDPATGECSHYWNPLEEDGDALRLAVKLGLRIDLRYTVGHPHANFNRVEYWLPNRVQCDWLEFGNHDDAQAATRRAIVRAAAEIGRSM